MHEITTLLLTKLNIRKGRRAFLNSFQFLHWHCLHASTIMVETPAAFLVGEAAAAFAAGAGAAGAGAAAAAAAGFLGAGEAFFLGAEAFLGAGDTSLGAGEAFSGAAGLTTFLALAAAVLICGVCVGGLEGVCASETWGKGGC